MKTGEVSHEFSRITLIPNSCNSWQKKNWRLFIEILPDTPGSYLVNRLYKIVLTPSITGTHVSAPSPCEAKYPWCSNQDYTYQVVQNAMNFVDMIRITMDFQIDKFKPVPFGMRKLFRLGKTSLK